MSSSETEPVSSVADATVLPSTAAAERLDTNEEATAPLLPAELEPARKRANWLLAELDRILLGQSELHRLVVVGILSRGHILLEGMPGVGKTQLVKALGQLLQLPFKRVQFTPDLMPGDILGAHILQERDGGHRELVFQPGPVFTSLLLADEINRASPKTQSALLEAMQERSVTLLGTTRTLPNPFFVLASQNPVELEGTYPLPEAQLDRFLFKLSVLGANVEVLEGIIATRRRGQPPEPTETLTADQLQALFQTVDRILLPRGVARYMARLVAATHPDSPLAPPSVKTYVQFGASLRAAIALAEAGRAQALLAGRPTVGFDDVKAVLLPILNHRLILNYKARMDRVASPLLVQELLQAVAEADFKLPRDVEVQHAS